MASTTTLRHYQFDNLAVHDSDDSGQQHDLEHLGTVIVRLWRVIPQKVTSFSPNPFQAVVSVKESSKKIGVHKVSLGQEAVCEEPIMRMSVKAIDPAEGYFVCFVFRYLLLALLQAQAIALLSISEQGPSRSSNSMCDRAGKRRPNTSIERSDSGQRKKPRSSYPDEDVKPALDVSDSESDGEDLDALKAGMQALQAQLKRMEKKVDRIQRDKRSSRSEKTKKERAPSPIMLKGATSSDVIDLTLSD